MHDPNGGGFGPPGGSPPQGSGFGPPPGGAPPPGGSGFGPPPGGAPPPGGSGFGPPPGDGFGPPTAQAVPQMAPIAGVEINVMPAVLMGIFVTVMCGCLPLGGGALYMADQAKKAGARGDESGAKQKLMISYGLSAASFLSAFFVVAAYMMVVIFANVH